MTVPDQSLTIREILERYTKGIPVQGLKVVDYDDTEDFNQIDPISIRNFDLSDYQSSLAVLAADSERRAKEEAQSEGAKRMSQKPKPEQGGSKESAANENDSDK